jgi:chloramphenicol 3-O-phosphotransferase
MEAAEPVQWEPMQAPQAPPAPRNVQETGLDPVFLSTLVLKSMHGAGKCMLAVLSGRLRLPVGVLREVLTQLVADASAEVSWRGDTELELQYQLTATGRQRATDALARCVYTGPAPVPLQAWNQIVQRQSVRHPRASRPGASDLDAAFSDDMTPSAVRVMAGAALHAGRTMLLHGPSGSGKSTLARKLARLQQGVVAIPHAVLVDGHVILVHDAQLHHAPTPMQAHQMENARSADLRWTLCQRPVIHAGAELERGMLELRFDTQRGAWRAPLQLLANNGVLLLDDLGRQRIAAQELVARLATPTDSGHELLALEGGLVSLPFDAMLIYATHLPLPGLLDDAALRRAGYKIRLGALDEPAYRNLFRQQCRNLRIVFDDTAYQHMLTRLHSTGARPLLAGVPKELLVRLSDFAAFAGDAPRLTPAALEQAWASLYGEVAS